MRAIVIALLCARTLGAPPHRNYVYAKLLGEGVAPTWADFMGDLELTREEARDALHELDAAHDAVLLPQQLGRRSEYILMCHPFSNLPTHHAADLDLNAVKDALRALSGNPRPAIQRVQGRVRRFGN